MAQLRGPDFVSLQVRDFAAARAFYTATLGYAVDARFDSADFVLFATNSIPFALTAAKVDLTTGQPGLGVALWLDCDDVDALHAQLIAAGATIITAPFDGPFGRTLVFTDLDGYRITANQNPWDRFPLGGAAPRR
jgi:predicted enzyme related to lactoylglutathione lyase